jgi:hypothetical protein
MKRLYIGSDSGLTVLTGDGAAWLPYREVLAGKFVRAMSAVRGVNRAYACVTQDGLYASRNGGESWQLVLPGDRQLLKKHMAFTEWRYSLP